MSDFSGKTALITGASRGFGAALAEELAERGAHVIALARTTGGLEDLDDRIQAKGGTATLVPLDISDEQGLQRMCLSIHQRWGGLDYWIHSAVHAAPLSPVGHIAEKDWDKSIATNLRAAQRVISNVEPLLKALGGTAVHLEDPHTGEQFFGAYGATKTAQKALFDSWAAENKTSGIKVVGFKPAPMPTANRARFFPGEERDGLSKPSSQARRLADLL